MDKQTPWLVVRDGKKCCLLAKNANAFYVIEVGKNLDWETEEWLMRQGISETLLKELKLTFTYIPRKDIRGVAFSGPMAGDRIYLYLRSEKRKLTLELDYEPAHMDEFFKNLHRFTAPKRKEPGDKGWRKEYQDPEIFEKLRILPPVFLIGGLASGIGYALIHHWMLFTACLVLCAIQIVLALLFPAYFTIFLPKGKREQNVYNLDFSLWLTGIWLLFGVQANWMDYSSLRWLIPVGIGFAALICWRVRDLHDCPTECFVCFLLSCFIAVYVAGQANVILDFDQPEPSVCQVEELHATGSGRRGRNYYCTVTLLDGSRSKLKIARWLYQELDEGDYVRVVLDTGALGVEYGIVYPIE